MCVGNIHIFFTIAVPLDLDNSEVQCLASEVKTPDFKKAICGDDETESEEAFLLYNTIPTYA